LSTSLSRYHFFVTHVISIGCVYKIDILLIIIGENWNEIVKKRLSDKTYDCIFDWGLNSSRYSFLTKSKSSRCICSVWFVEIMWSCSLYVYRYMPLYTPVWLSISIRDNLKKSYLRQQHNVLVTFHLISIS
jgi:hypothetical protein